MTLFRVSSYIRTLHYRTHITLQNTHYATEHTLRYRTHLTLQNTPYATEHTLHYRTQNYK